MAVVQRFGRALNLNVHVHALVVDGVFVSGAGGLAFAPADDLSDLDVAEVLATVVPRIDALLARRGHGDDDGGGGAPDGFAEAAPALAGMAAAAVQGTTAMGQRAGARTRRCGEALEHAGANPLPRCHANQDGFDLEAGVRVRADQRERLERLCRYVLRPPLAGERLRLLEDGDVLLALERQWSDGTTHLRFSPIELLERLAVLIPRPRINLVLYYGILGPRAAWPFDPAQGHPERRRGMEVAHRRLWEARGDRRDDRRWRPAGCHGPDSTRDAGRTTLGRPDAQELRHRRPRVPTLRRPPPAHLAD